MSLPSNSSCRTFNHCEHFVSTVLENNQAEMAQTNVLVALFSFNFLHQLVSSEVLLKIPQGSLEGATSKTAKGHEFYSFLGIPYAKSPEGNLRFQPPVAAGSWEGIFKADRERPCPQVDMYLGLHQLESEDCLFVNVFTRSPPSAKKVTLRPVMVFIHGGAFISGSGSPLVYGPDHFIDEDVVFITFNYRLGAFGFLSMGDDVMPGNAGLWDQRLVLRWIQKNIEYFGGDPNLVTIFGESAGSMSVMYHYLSPQSKGLFSGAIAQSGMTNSVFTLTNKHPAYYTRTIAKQVGCDPGASSKSILKCLQKVAVEDLAKLALTFEEFIQLPVPYKPIVDNFTSNPFLPAEPEEMIESGQFNHVPLVFGSNKEEGLVSAIKFIMDTKLFVEMSEDWENAVALLFLGREASEVTKFEREFAAEFLTDKFGGQKPSAEHGTKALIDAFSDTMFNAASSVNGRKLALKSDQPVYEYLYTHQGSLSLTDFLGGTWKLLARGLFRYFNVDPLRNQFGVAHADELFLMFKNSLLPFKWVESQEDQETRQNLVHLLTNFARSGNPTPSKESSVKWERIDPRAPKHMDIGSKLAFESDSAEVTERISYWTKVWEKFPPSLHLYRSATWKNSKLYKKKEEDTLGSKQEL